jgi:hypothetical protein
MVIYEIDSEKMNMKKASKLLKEAGYEFSHIKVYMYNDVKDLIFYNENNVKVILSYENYKYKGLASYKENQK